MREPLWLNTAVHLRFYARNRLLLAFGLVMLGMMGLSMLPMILMDTSANRFSLLQMIIGQLNGYALVFTASLGLFALSSHLRARNVKMVLTKPCRPETWLASIFLSALLVGVVLHGLVALAGTALSLAWSIPLQPGLVFIALEGFFRSAIWLAVLTTLTMVFHPVLALLVALVFSEGTFYGLKYLVASAVATSGPGAGLTVAGVVCDIVYTLLPMSEPFSDRTETVHSSWRVFTGDWLMLGAVFGYSLLMTVFLYLLSLYLLRRRALV